LIIDFLSIKINISVDDTKKIINDLLSIDQSKLEFINKSCGELLYYDIFKIIRSVNTDVVIQNSILHYIIVEIIKKHLFIIIIINFLYQNIQIKYLKQKYMM